MPTPIAIFAYNRADMLAGMMNSVRACPEFDRSSVTIFVDGPSSDRDAPDVQEVREYVTGLNFPNISTRISLVNKGLRRSIYEGVSEICARNGRVIVLEDDLVLGRGALAWFNAGLDRYEDDPSIWSICGYIYDAPELRARREALVLPWAHPWGWATWKRAWDNFDLEARPDAAALESKAFRHAFDLGGVYPFTQQLKQSLKGRINSWYIHWYYTIFANGGRSVFPPRRVLDNFGISRGTHGGRLNPHERLVRRPDLMEEPIAFPISAQTNTEALPALKSCKEASVQRNIARAGRVKRWLQALMTRPSNVNSKQDRESFKVKAGLVHITCPHCGADDTKPWATENGFTVVRCSSCGLLYVNPRPAEETITDANKVGVHQGEEGALDVKARRVGSKVAYYAGILSQMFRPEIEAGKPLRWLDVGAGYGEVVEAVLRAMPMGTEPLGIEPMAPKVAVAKKLGLPVDTRSLSDAGTGYDVISLINVYSHIPDFQAFGSELVDKLKPGGVLFLETGNLADLEKREDFGDILYLPDHLVFSGVTQMTAVLERLGLVVEEYQQRRTDTPLSSLKMFLKGLMRKRLVIKLPGTSPVRAVFYKARKNQELS